MIYIFRGVYHDRRHFQCRDRLGPAVRERGVDLPL